MPMRKRTYFLAGRNDGYDCENVLEKKRRPSPKRVRSSKRRIPQGTVHKKELLVQPSIPQ